VTTEQIIYAIIGGGGFGILLAAILHGVTTGWGKNPASPGNSPRPTVLPEPTYPKDHGEEIAVSVPSP